MSDYLTCIIVDCADPETLASFWAALLDREIGWRIGPYVFLKREPGDGIGLGFQRVAEPKTGKNRVHPDLNCEDVHATAAKVLQLGGSRVQGYERGGFLVVADPEGNEFCLLPRGSFKVDDEGNADYLRESDGGTA